MTRRKTNFGFSLILLVGSLVVSRPALAAVPPVWESSFGSDLGLSDDGTSNVVFGFSFPFLGSNFTGGTVSSNGFLSLGGSVGADCCDASVSTFLNDALGRVAVAWYDLDPSTAGAVRYNTFTGRAVVTWDAVPEFDNTTGNIFQMQLFSDGKVIFGYDVLTPNGDPSGGHRHHALVGLTPGNGASDPGEVDYSTALPLNTGSQGTVYEFFARGPNGSTAVGGDTFDLAGTNLCFTPNGNNGWNVSSDCAAPTQEESIIPEPGSVLLFSLGALGAAAFRRRRIA